MLKYKAMVESRDRKDKTPLISAIERGHKKVVEQLLAAGADVDLQGGVLWDNALQAAAVGGHEKMVKQLLAAGMDVNIQSGRWSNALRVAALRGHEKVVEQLLTVEADVNAEGGMYTNALSAAKGGSNEKIVERLLPVGSESEECHICFQILNQTLDLKAKRTIRKTLAILFLLRVSCYHEFCCRMLRRKTYILLDTPYQ